VPDTGWASLDLWIAKPRVALSQKTGANSAFLVPAPSGGGSGTGRKVSWRPLGL